MLNSHRESHRVAGAVAAVCAGLVLSSAAGAVDLRDWGRKFPASERFVVLSQFSNQAVLDKETQLVWMRAPLVSKSNQPNAVAACTDVTRGGRLGWRLPSVHELSSLADPSVAVAALALPAGNPFLAVPVGKYWTATTDRFGRPFYVDFADHGYTNIDLYTTDAHIWCVRGGGPIGEY